MAGLTKEQRAERDAIKQKELEAQERSDNSISVEPIEVVIHMTRDVPSFAGGPTDADVHTDEIDRWIDDGWQVSE
ncbi:hypothetical protein Ppb6_01194 [Photorhabdus australis subsp. thailandensis]|uniref:Uncharacterized protein n=1 Tax=Photorhabdus australis subsp. thailandensis TaxID=2805096 RepID=A0A1C0U6M5_9GAMM|nr:hypothetical protein [Photorhabdus australis]OCQ53568.1 hypothetical protein Ppb6_01194 [Photorhabdus australis subsp. thailandensis]